MSYVRVVSLKLADQPSLMVIPSRCHLSILSRTVLSLAVFCTLTRRKRVGSSTRRVARDEG